jgi:hypothetical protein
MQRPANLGNGPDAGSALVHLRPCPRSARRGFSPRSLGRKKRTMSGIDNQVEYWDRAAREKTFSHPLNLSKFSAPRLL